MSKFGAIDGPEDVQYEIELRKRQEKAWQKSRTLTITDLFRGKEMNIETDAKVVVVLEIKTISEVIQEGDIFVYEVSFTNGHKKVYRSFSELVSKIVK